MTRVYENEVFTGYRDRDSARLFEDIEFRKCIFVNSHVSITRDPALRSVVRNVRVIDCTRKRDPAGLQCPIVDECLIENLKTEDLFQTWGAVFRHVTLRGRFGRLMISTNVLPTYTKGKAVVEAFRVANAAYYSTVDWALDISQAEFQELDIRGIPADLIRRDPATQVVVRRSKALEGKWLELDLEKTYWPTSLRFMLNRNDPDAVLVAPKRSRRFEVLLDGLRLLRAAGVADPD